MPYQALKKESDARAFRLKNMFTTLAFATALLTQAAQAGLASAIDAPPINWNGSHVAIVGVERDNSVFVPLRGFFEKLDAQVSNSGSSFVAKRQGKELARVTVGSRRAIVNGSPQTLSAAPFMSSGTVMLPLRVISEAAGASVAYVAEPRAVNVTRSSDGAGVGMAGAAAAGAAAATVAQAASATATDVASAAPVADAQTSNNGIPWWVWLLLGLIILGLILWVLTRRKKEPIITTTSARRTNEATITTTSKGSGSDPTINTRK